jgi:hypothetical protein
MWTFAIQLPTRDPDLAIARACACRATARQQLALRLVTYLADENLVIGVTALVWAYTRLAQPDRASTRGADEALCAAAACAALSHVLKFLMDRRRPNRVVEKAGVRNRGNRWILFHLDTLSRSEH